MDDDFGRVYKLDRIADFISFGCASTEYRKAPKRLRITAYGALPVPKASPKRADLPVNGPREDVEDDPGEYGQASQYEEDGHD